MGNVGSRNSDVASIFSTNKLTKDERNGFNLYEEAFGSSNEPNVKLLIEQYMMGKYSIFLMGSGNKIVAFSIIKDVGVINNIKVAHVEYLCVDSSTRGSGLGSKFVKQILQHYLQSYELLSLQCSDDLLGFYRKNGFELISTNSYWQTERYNMMCVCSFPITNGEYLANRITDIMNRTVWSKY